MIEIRLHGRGGQGAVTSAELTALAAIGTGKYVQAFPSFGPERRGALVMAFIRVSEKPIKTREKVYNPDIVVVLDPSLLGLVHVAAGSKPAGRDRGGEYRKERGRDPEADQDQGEPVRSAGEALRMELHRGLGRA